MIPSPLHSIDTSRTTPIKSGTEGLVPRGDQVQAIGSSEGQHWRIDPEHVLSNDSRLESESTSPAPIPAPEQTEISVEEIVLNLSAQIHASGMNAALQRLPRIEVGKSELISENLGTVRWRPQWKKPATLGVTFPAGFEFAQKKTAPSESAGEEKPPQELTGNPKPKVTRIKPPREAVTIEDRLFYLLQPPLETWLKGQELIMPFEPFPYQYEGIAWLFGQQSGLLADEMGLGKTMQTITALRLLLRSGQVGRILLVCPKPLIPNWQREFRSWAEELPLVTMEGDHTRRKMLWTMPGTMILLVNYELLVRDMEMFSEDPPKFDLVILDEAQRIKNRDSRTAESARGVHRKRSWALTGTPVENRPEELASLFEFLEVIPKHSAPDLRQLSKLAKNYILRRTKDLVMTDLPPRLDREEFLDLTTPQRLAYDTAEKEGIVRLSDMGDAISVQHVFELVLRLKQICNFDPRTEESVKMERLEADMEEIAASGGKAILFSQWTMCLDWIEKKLARFQPLAYHGKIPARHREDVLKRFKEDPKASLLLMSYATGAVGLNLQFAGYVFLFDRWWNPAVEDQAINRAHRIGQKSKVIVTKFICRDTIEERINRVLMRKRELFREVLGDSDNSNVSLSMNASEIFGLFDLRARHGKGTRSISPPPVNPALE